MSEIKLKTKTTKEKNKELVFVIKKRFDEGARVSINQLTGELFDPQDTFTFVKGKDKVRHLFERLKKLYKKEGLWFGCIDGQGNYGVADTAAEARHALTRYYKLAKGVSTNASFLAREAHENGILETSTEVVRLPKVEDQ